MKILSAGFLAAALVLVPVVGHAQTIKIGLGGPMTGGESAFGLQMKNGAERAIADLNASGGILGRQLELVVRDDGCDPKQALSVAERFVGDKVSLVVGHFCSSSSIPASNVYADSNILQISPASTNPIFTERKLWNVFRVTGRDDQQGAVAAQHILKNYSGKNVAILHDKTTYGKGLADEVKKALNAGGLREKFSDSFDKGSKDFNADVSRLKRENVDILYVGGYYQEAGLMLRQMRDAGLKTVLISGDAVNDREFSSIAGPAADGALFTFGPDPRTNLAAKALVEQFKGRSIDPEGYTLYAYAAVQVWAQGVAAARSIESRTVANTLKAGAFNTALGGLSFDAKGDRKQIDYVVYRWDGKGNYRQIDSSAPTPVAAVAAPPAPAVAPKPVPPPPAAAEIKPPPVVAVPAPAIVAPPPKPPVVASISAKQPSSAIPDQGRRVALVIGNSAYKNVSALPNPKSDAASIASALRQTGFQSVTLLTDLDRDKLTNALQKFAEIAETADWSVVYFAGHGMEIGGVNYLIPIDAKLSSDRDIAFQAIPLEVVLNAAERAKKLRLVILDACRDNPFAAQMKRSMTVATRSVTRGLAQVEPEAGTMVVYSAKHGETALDGTGGNSPFATALAKNIQTPGLEVRLLFDTVRDDVMDLTGRKQQPFSYGSISARQQFYFTAAR